MRFIKQSLEIPVRNNDTHTSCASENTPKRHSDLLPNSVRAIICGPSGVNSVISFSIFYK